MEFASAEELFARAQLGDSAALGQLLETYREQLHRDARSQLDSQVRVRTDASDIVQGTFLEAQRDFTQFRGESVAQLLAWLRTILDHNVSNTIQHHVFVQSRMALIRDQRLHILDLAQNVSPVAAKDHKRKLDVNSDPSEWIQLFDGKTLDGW